MLCGKYWEEGIKYQLSDASEKWWKPCVKTVKSVYQHLGLIGSNHTWDLSMDHSENPCFLKIIFRKRPWSFGDTDPKLEYRECAMCDVENDARKLIFLCSMCGLNSKIESWMF